MNATVKMNLKNLNQVCYLEGIKRAVKKKAATLQRQKVMKGRGTIRNTALQELRMHGQEGREGTAAKGYETGEARTKA